MCMVTIYYYETKNHKINTLYLYILTNWSIDEMHAWSPYMKQKNRKQVINQHCIKILSKLTSWSIDEKHAWSPYMKTKE